MTHQETVPFLIGSKNQAPSKSHTETIEWWGVAMGLSIKCRKSWWPEVALMATHNPFTSIDIFHLSRSCKKWEKRSCLSHLLFSFLFLALFEALVVPRKSFPCHTRCSEFSLAEKASWKCQDSYQFVNKNKSALIELRVPHAEQGTRHMLSHWFFPPTNGRWVKIIHNSSNGQKNQHTLCYLNIPLLPLSPQFQWWQKLQGEETETKQKQTEIPLSWWFNVAPFWVINYSILLHFASFWSVLLFHFSSLKMVKKFRENPALSIGLQRGTCSSCCWWWFT